MMFYFDNDYVDNVIIKNDSNRCDDIKNILIDKFKVKYKENKEGAQQKKIVDLGYVDFFDNKDFFMNEITSLLLSQMYIYSMVIWIQHILMKLVWGLQFIMLEASTKEIIYQLMFLI